jgi:hypothetical protein
VKQRRVEGSALLVMVDKCDRPAYALSGRRRLTPGDRPARPGPGPAGRVIRGPNLAP